MVYLAAFFIVGSASGFCSALEASLLRASAADGFLRRASGDGSSSRALGGGSG